MLLLSPSLNGNHTFFLQLLYYIYFLTHGKWFQSLTSLRMYATEADLAGCYASIGMTAQIRYLSNAGHGKRVKRVGLCIATCIRYHHNESLLILECQAIMQMIVPCFWKQISGRMCIWNMNKYIILFLFSFVCVCVCLCACVLVCMHARVVNYVSCLLFIVYAIYTFHMK
jgi:hypothetical protein